MMIVYVSGPMTGLPDLNYPAFYAAARELAADGHDVVNPARPFHHDTSGYRWSDYMRRALRDLSECDAIVLLPGWDASKGAKLEHRIAVELGLTVLELNRR